MFQNITKKILDRIVAELDQDGDGKFTVEDLQKAAVKAEEKLKAKQTNWFVGSLVALASFGGGFIVHLVAFCRHC